MRLGATPLIAAASYALDVSPEGCQYHGWRVALLAHSIASRLAPEIATDVFYAGLMHEVGSVGNEPVCITNRPAQRGGDARRFHASAALLRWLPGMGRAADFLLSLQDSCQGSQSGDEIAGSLGSQILRQAIAVDAAGCFDTGSQIAGCLGRLSPCTGKWWNKDTWVALIEWMRDPDNCRSLSDTTSLAKVVQDRLEQIGTPPELDNEAGLERALHLIAALVDIKDPSTAGHSRRTAKYAQTLARHTHLSDEECLQVYRCGLVHDFGRLGLPSFLFNNSQRLNDRSLQIVRKHALMTIRIFGCLPDCPEMTELGYVAGHDHERYDGHGYPDRLEGRNIPMLSRVLGVVDAFDAMTLPRDFRILSPKAAVLRLKQNSGSQFDPPLVDAMTEAVDGGEIEVEIKEAA